MKSPELLQNPLLWIVALFVVTTLGMASVTLLTTPRAVTPWGAPPEQAAVDPEVVPSLEDTVASLDDEPLYGAFPEEELEMAERNRRAVFERNLSTLQEAAAEAERQGQAERAALLRRRADALQRRAAEER
ncbi:MAG: hypothetical protein H6739_37185 [Alphaproteobacteria bacterium]|nr:hypothetical protein [Alphaproteobacteria bacterium]